MQNTEPKRSTDDIEIRIHDIVENLNKSPFEKYLEMGESGEEMILYAFGITKELFGKIDK